MAWFLIASYQGLERRRLMFAVAMLPGRRMRLTVSGYAMIPGTPVSEAGGSVGMLAAVV